MTLRPYEHERDLEDSLRIYREVGWLREEKHEEATGLWFSAGRGWVAEIHGRAECLVLSVPGIVRYQEHDLPLCAVAGVTTSRIARKRGLAGVLTSRLLAECAEAGDAVAMLGVFEQGYYDQLGFGNGSYEHRYTFDPSALQVSEKPDIPVRLSAEDWQSMHDSRLARLHAHGSCSLLPAVTTRADALWTEEGFGLGYLDEHGNLSHHIWCSAKGEHGTYSVPWMTYRNREQFHELLALLHSLSDQVHSVALHEPPGLVLQDFIRQPFKMRRITERSPHESRLTASAWWQVRVLDVERCVSALCSDSVPVRFNLALSDPVASYGLNDCNWKGNSGSYVVTLGPESRAEKGTSPSLPTLHASVNAFSRLWLGAASATSLSWSDRLEAPGTLLQALDRTFRLPVPHPDWDF
jgi:hypothetical protein